MSIDSANRRSTSDMSSCDRRSIIEHGNEPNKEYVKSNDYGNRKQVVAEHTYLGFDEDCDCSVMTSSDSYYDVIKGHLDRTSQNTYTRALVKIDKMMAESKSLRNQCDELSAEFSNLTSRCRFIEKDVTTLRRETKSIYHDGQIDKYLVDMIQKLNDYGESISLAMYDFEDTKDKKALNATNVSCDLFADITATPARMNTHHFDIPPSDDQIDMFDVV